jgi:hypothetical protein
MMSLPPKPRGPAGAKTVTVFRGSAMVCLLARQSRRSRRWTMFTMFLFLAPAIGAALTDSHTFRTFLLLLAATLGLLVPVAQLAGDGVVLASLRRGRCLEEILATRLSSQEMVDQVALHGILSVLGPGLAVFLPLMAGLLAFVPVESRLGILATALLFFPATALATWVGSNNVQAAVVWSEGREALVAATGILSLGVAVGLLSLAHTPQGAALVVMILVVWGFVAREVAQAGLKGLTIRRRARLHPSLPPRHARRLHNAISFREAARSRPSWSGPFLLGALSVAILLVLCRSWAPDLLQPLAWLFLTVVQPARASLATVGALVREREEQTLEPLVLTGISPGEFLDGWALRAARPILWESLFMAALLAGLALLETPSETLAIHVELPNLLLKVCFGAWLGLAVSTFTRTRRESWTWLFLAWVAGGLYLTLVPGTFGSLLAVWWEATDLQTAAPLAGPLFSLAWTLAGTLALRGLAWSRVQATFAPQSPKT